MSSLQSQWSYLIRFVSAADDLIYFGDAVVPPDAFHVGWFDNTPSIQARIITGNPFSGNYDIQDIQTPVKKILGPLTRECVPDIRCIGGNYVSHLRELACPLPKNPPMFPKLTNALAGHNEAIEIPSIAQDDQADYEGELVVVIGKDAKNVAAADAMEYVLGYSIANDLSARKWQMDPELVGTVPPPQMSFAKSFDGFCPVGPCIVSSKMVQDPHALQLTTVVNKEIRQQASTKELFFNIPKIIEFCSQGSTLFAGSIILTGTPSGVGVAMKPPRFLKDGDEVEIGIDKIGTLRHWVKYV